MCLKLSAYADVGINSVIASSLTLCGSSYTYTLLSLTSHSFAE